MDAHKIQQLAAAPLQFEGLPEVHSDFDRSRLRAPRPTTPDAPP